MSGKLLLYIFSMALVTYLLRVLPLVLLRRKIESPFLNSLFTYLPYRKKTECPKIYNGYIL